jgi:hypothetical protein
MILPIKNYVKDFTPIHWITVCMAIALQIQVTLFADGAYLGIRVGLADIFIPVIGLYVLFSLIAKRSLWPQWLVPRMPLWLFGLAGVMTVSLVNGYFVNETLLMWAFVNKYVGFYLLLSYLLLGGWVLSNAKDHMQIFTVFTLVFSGFFVLTMLASTVLVYAQYFFSFPLWLSDYPWDGFMANRNAYVVLFVLTFIFIVYDYAKKEHALPLWVINAFWICVPIFYVFNDSRTGWIVSVFLALLLFSKDTINRLKTVLPVLCIGFMVAYGSYYLTNNVRVLKGYQMQYLLMLADDGDTEYLGDQKRYIAVEDGLDLYSHHNPVIGAGLGSYKQFQIEKRGEYIDVMDFTGLWLLVETGALGLIVFSAFFLMSAWVVYRQGYMKGGVSEYHKALFVFLIAFAFMSILHELMYTRVLWFAMGLALAKGKVSA